MNGLESPRLTLMTSMPSSTSMGTRYVPTLPFPPITTARVMKILLLLYFAFSLYALISLRPSDRFSEINGSTNLQVATTKIGQPQIVGCHVPLTYVASVSPGQGGMLM